MGRKAGKDIPRFTTGFLASVLCIYFIVQGREDLTLLAASVFLLLICVTDTLTARIPNLLNLALILTGFGYHLYRTGAEGLLFSMSGLALGLALLLVPYLMGGMGAGDVKALMALGALLGPAEIVQVFIYTVLFGGVLAVFHYLLAHDLRKKIAAGASALKAFLYSRDPRSLLPSRKGASLRFPYAAAFAFGFFAYRHWGGFL